MDAPITLKVAYGVYDSKVVQQPLCSPFSTKCEQANYGVIKLSAKIEINIKF